MYEDHDELRFVCKLCDKRFPSGKSLGGHMRSHVIAAANLVESNDKFESMNQHSSLVINEIDNVNSNSYGLRENPKKSWRVFSSSSTLPSPNEQICKQCGKGFQSLKALCGHMAFHSEKHRELNDYDYSWTSENLDLENEDKFIEDSCSDTDEQDEHSLQDPVCVTRSNSRRYKKVVIKPTSLSLTNTNSTNSNYNYGSSSVSEIDEFGQEEVAMCLMMLSKDTANWGGFDSVVESSENTAVELETKWSSVEMKNTRKESDSGYCRNGIKKVELDNSVANQLRNLTFEEKQEIRRNLFREFGYDNSLNKRLRNDDSYKKRSKYECLNCNKTFSSFQGLGGHRPCHKKNNTLNACGNDEYARDQKAKFEKKRSKKNKGHECPICFRMFKSGQALGGHKRSHFINGAYDRIDDMAAMRHAGSSYTDMIDLNLPAPEED